MDGEEKSDVKGLSGKDIGRMLGRRRKSRIELMKMEQILKMGKKQRGKGDSGIRR